MKKFFALALAVLALLVGCAQGAAGAPKGDFSFNLPEGYELSEESDTRCTVLRTEDSTAVGGMETTTLTSKELKNEGKEMAAAYLQEQFHQSDAIEYLVSFWGKERPVVTVSLKKGENQEFSHMFFGKDDCVYHVWFDLGVIDREEADRFLTITGLK